MKKSESIDMIVIDKERMLGRLVLMENQMLEIGKRFSAYFDSRGNVIDYYLSAKEELDLARVGIFYLSMQLGYYQKEVKD